MAVTMNSIGNYSAYNFKTTNAGKSFTKHPTSIKPEEINNEEKKFFAGMYPAKQSEIMEYYYYEKSGRMNGIAVGTNIDRRG
ncbi:MAG: hypothetical protein ROY99_05325 [Ignavibacterium sp.]|jgi:hypothetical protein|nr:hypothetical protein [Ignavibacterium sp.]